MPELVACEGNIMDQDLLSSPLPCLLVNGDGIILNASPAVKRICASVANRPLSDAFGISREALAEHLASQGQRVLVGESVDINERTNHVLAQAVEVPECAATLVVLTDLGPSRHAEEQRFNVTPYPVLRLSYDGRIVFTNEAAQRSLGANLIDQPLANIFPEMARAELIREFATDPRESSEYDLPAPDALQSSEGATEVRLFLMPDLGPGDYIIGRIAVISWDPYEKYRDALGKAVDQGGGWDLAFRRMLDALREAVPHDRAIFGVFAEDGTRFRAMLVHPQPEPPWPRRWVNVPPERSAKVAKGPYIDNDWDETIRAFPKLLEDPTVRRNVDDGIVGILVLPIGGRGIPDGVLTLASRRKAAFGGQALPLLSSLRIESHVATLLRMAERESTAAVRRIGDGIVKAQNIGIAADLLLKGLVTQFQWDHAAIFFADLADKRTLLARQYPNLNESGTLDELAVVPGYSQPLDPNLPEESGMLGAAFFAGEPLLVEDTEALGADGKPRFNYRTAVGSRHRRSAMTVPIRVNGEIRWLLDIESLTTHAFGNDDKRMVERIVRHLEQRMALLNERVLSVALLNTIEQGTIMTDRAGRILRANRRAEELLRLNGPRTDWGRIGDYGADEQSRNVLASHGIVERQPLRICSLEGGVGNAVLASRRDLDSDTGDSVWLFTDLRVDEWQHDSHFIESTIREVARQARGPLMLAASFIKRIAEGAVGSDLALRAVAELGKADVTYERIAESVEARKAPLRDRCALTLNALLSELYKTLPKWDADRIRLVLPSEPVLISGDGGRIELTLRVIVAFFLAKLRYHAANGKMIDVTLRHRTGLAVIKLSFPQAEKSSSRLTKLRVQPGAPLETASIIIAAHSGRIVGADLDSGTPRMEIRLPLFSEVDHGS
jgi:PAS domain-containing protein